MKTFYKFLVLCFLVLVLGVYLLCANHFEYGIVVLLFIVGVLQDPIGRFVVGFVAAGIVVVCAAAVWAFCHWQTRRDHAVIIELLNWIIDHTKT